VFDDVLLLCSGTFYGYAKRHCTECEIALKIPLWIDLNSNSKPLLKAMP